MPYGVPIDIEIVEHLPHTDFVEETDGGFIIDERTGYWKPCRVSLTRWYPSVGQWVDFGGYRPVGASWFHYETCGHRLGHPHSFHPEEMNFNPGMVNPDKQVMHDPVVDRTKLKWIKKIQNDHSTGRLENFHLVCRNEDNSLFLDFIFEDVDYEHRLTGTEWDDASDHGGTTLDIIRADGANHAPPLQPCPDCVSWPDGSPANGGEISLEVDMENVHGAYGLGMKLRGGSDSALKVVANSQWLILTIGGRRLAIQGRSLQRLKGYRFNALLCIPWF